MMTKRKPVLRRVGHTVIARIVATRQRPLASAVSGYACGSGLAPFGPVSPILARPLLNDERSSTNGECRVALQSADNRIEFERKQLHSQFDDPLDQGDELSRIAALRTRFHH